MSQLRGFASDNSSGAHPAILAAIAAANTGHALAYGGDSFTRAAEQRLAEHFGADSRAFFVFGGTGANVVGLAALLRPYQALICAHNSHVNVDECGAAERFIGCKLLPVRADDGKLTPQALAPLLARAGDVHSAQPGVISVTQPTEQGTVYAIAELQALADFARAHGLKLHMDGARLANAAAALELPLAAVTRDVGVDVLSFGGTKNGLLYGEAVVVFDPTLAAELPWARKQGLQLASKMRFIAAQFDALLRDDLWRRNATHANRMAARLAAAVAGLPGLVITQPVQTNAVFARLPRDFSASLQEEYQFYVWDESRDEVRWMTSFDTTEDDVDGFAARIRAALAGEHAR